MSRTSDEPDFGEVRGLLRRLETTSQSTGVAPANHGYASLPGDAAARPVRAQQGMSAAATLFLVANTVMTTATMTSIAWYLFHSAEMQKNNRVGAGPGVPPGAFEWPPREYGTLPVASPAALPQAVAPVPSVIARLVGPPTFDIAPGKAARLSMQLLPREAIASADHVTIGGIPNDITFNHGVRSGSDGWTIPIGKLPELELTASAGVAAGHFNLVFTAHAPDGRDLASAGTTLVVAAEAATEPPGQPVVPLDEATQTQHIAKAREFLAIGQVSAARLVLQRTADSGNAEAALILGDTYDPVRLFQLGARGLVGDIAKATFWYEKADELGSSEAKARIISLRQN